MKQLEKIFKIGMYVTIISAIIFAIIFVSNYGKQDNEEILDSLVNQRMRIEKLKLDHDTIKFDLRILKKDTKQIKEKLDTIDTKVDIIYDRVKKTDNSIWDMLK